MVDLKDNTIIIVPNYLKEQTLLYINSTQKLKNIKVMSLKSFIENYFFSYNEQAIYFLINKYGIKLFRQIFSTKRNFISKQTSYWNR